MRAGHSPGRKECPRTGSIPIRSGLPSAGIVFLSLNDYDFRAPDGAVHEFVLSIARNEHTKVDATLFLQNYTRPAKPPPGPP